MDTRNQYEIRPLVHGNIWQRIVLGCNSMALDHVSAENVTIDRTVIGTELASDEVNCYTLAGSTNLVYCIMMACNTNVC
jgi:hypothetical protein